MNQSPTPAAPTPVRSADFLPQLFRRVPEAVARAAVRATRRGGPPRDRQFPRLAALWVQLAGALLADRSWTRVAAAVLDRTAARGVPTDAALRRARGRLGLAPLRDLTRRLVRPLATPAAAPAAFYRGLRLLGLDGTTLDVPDSPANDRAFGRAANGRGKSHRPQLRLVALCELGTHAFLKWIVKPCRASEVPMALALLPAVGPGDLLLHDCGFYGLRLWDAARRRGAELLGRVKAGPLLTARVRLPDGSYLARMYPTTRDRMKDTRGRDVRVVEYVHRDPNRPRCGERTRLVTTLLDPARYPADELVELYHRRWEHELAFGELKVHLDGRPVPVRSRTPLGVLQEVEALMPVHYLLRSAMAEAGELAGVAPLGLSFAGTLDVVRLRLREAPPAAAADRVAAWWAEVLMEVGRQVLRPRRGRRYPRAVKAGRRKYPSRKPDYKETATEPFAGYVDILKA